MNIIRITKDPSTILTPQCKTGCCVYIGGEIHAEPCPHFYEALQNGCKPEWTPGQPLNPATFNRAIH